MDKIKADKIVLIEWIDSHVSAAAWDTLDELKDLKPLHCTTVGFVLEDTDDYVMVAMSKHKHQVMGAVVIPRVAVLSIKTIPG